jgi:FkbM family methyltransferase
MRQIAPLQSWLYRPLRNVYQRVFNRDYWRERKILRERLRPFVPPGSLAFDVGANRGHYAEALLELGARVVAVEPNPELAATIRRHYRGITVEAVAIGAEPGKATLRVGTYDGHSTLSGEWAALHPERWIGELDVDVTTLDALIARYGEPAFVKIDVEGFEPEVVSGLSVPVAALSFEYQARAPGIAESALRAVERLGHYEFAVARADGPLGPWGDAEAVQRSLAAHADADSEGYGDIYARTVA